MGALSRLDLFVSLLERRLLTILAADLEATESLPPLGLSLDAAQPASELRPEKHEGESRGRYKENIEMQQWN